MLNQAILKELTQKDIGKDKEKIIERLKTIWMTEKSKRDEILSFAGLKKYTVQHSCKHGNISAKLVLAMAQVLEINPYYLTGESDEREGYSDEVVRQFLIDNKYGHLVEGAVKPKRAYNRKQPVAVNVSDQKPNEELPEVESSDAETSQPPNELIVTDTTESNNELVKLNETPDSPYDSLLSQIQNKMRTISDDELTKIESMTKETAEQLLTGLYLRIDYNEDAKRLAVLIKLMLTL